MEIYITDTAFGGSGIGKVNGKVFFVDYSVPGDTLIIESFKDRKSFSYAKIKEIIKASPHRIEPSCPNFGICGGCSYLNVDYDMELQYKKSILISLLYRPGGLEEKDIPEIDIVQSERHGYRSHTLVKSEGHGFGLYKKRTNDVAPFPAQGCGILAPELNNFIKTLDYKKISSETRVAADLSGKIYYDTSDAPGFIDEHENNITYRRELNGFFQANRFLRGKMLEIVKDYSSLTPDDEFIDIGCGCGFFTLYQAQYASRGYGFDVDRKSIEHAEYNASTNRIENLKFFTLSSSDIHPHKVKPSLVIVDPPRMGLTKKTRQTVNAMNPEKIVYVSCNPSTFARDIRDFITQGYSLDRVTMIDMFPGTHHIEIITRLSKG
jgi:23S rRNA (uracil1939-C5)-methyltransferase